MVKDVSAGWCNIAFSELLKQSDETIEVDPTQNYQQITVRMWGNGVVSRGWVTGDELGSSRWYVAHQGQFILSKIDARHGAFGLVPPELEGAIVSNDFPLFDIDASKAVPEYLYWLSRTHDFVDLCKRASEGTTNRVRLKLDRFLAAEIPLPPIDEQRRIVAHIDALAEQIAAARGLRHGAVEETRQLLRAILFFQSGWQPELTPMSDLATLRTTDVAVEPDDTYHFAGVYSFGRGVFAGSVKKGSEFKYTRLTRLCAKDFVYPKLMAWEGAFGVVPAECDGLVVSPEFPVFEVDSSRILPEVLDVYFKTPDIWTVIAGSSTGTNVRRRRLHPSTFLDYKFPLPPMNVQLELRDVKHQLEDLTRLHNKVLAELDALLPSLLDRAFRGEL
jgi:type I restriction enzyme S subunit